MERISDEKMERFQAFERRLQRVRTSDQPWHSELLRSIDNNEFLVWLAEGAALLTERVSNMGKKILRVGKYGQS